MTRDGTARPAGLVALVAVMAFQGLSGVAGGLGLVYDPSGAVLGLPEEWLRGSPFADYLIPGLVLLTVLGVGPLLALCGLWRGRPWSRTASLLVGGALVAWLGVQVAVVGYRTDPPLQLVYGGVAGLILVLASLPSVRAHTGPRRPGTPVDGGS